MAKETVRYPDALVTRIETFVTDSSAFESKSEYHRFASEFLLSLLDADHSPSVLGYDEIFRDLEVDLGDALGSHDGTDQPFLDTYIRVRRHLLRGDLDEARAVVDETYDVTDREALLLDEVIAQARDTETAAAVNAESTPRARTTERQRESNGRLHPDGSASEPDQTEQSEGTPDAEASDGESAVDPGADERAIESEY